MVGFKDATKRFQKSAGSELLGSSYNMSQLMSSFLFSDMRSNLPAANAYVVRSGQTRKGKCIGPAATLKGRPSPFVYSGFSRTVNAWKFNSGQKLLNRIVSMYFLKEKSPDYIYINENYKYLGSNLLTPMSQPSLFWSLEPGTESALNVWLRHETLFDNETFKKNVENIRSVSQELRF